MQCLNDMHAWTSSTRRPSEGPGPSSKGDSFCGLCQELGAHPLQCDHKLSKQDNRTQGKDEQAAEGVCGPGSLADHVPPGSSFHFSEPQVAHL